MKLADFKGKVVDVILINGNYYREVTVLDVDEHTGGMFVQDNPEIGGDPYPYYLGSIAEIREIFTKEDLLKMQADGYNVKTQEEKHKTQLFPIRKKKEKD